MKCPLCKGEGFIEANDLSWLIRQINHAIRKKAMPDLSWTPCISNNREALAGQLKENTMS